MAASRVAGFFLAVALCFLSPTPATAGFDDGFAAYERGDYQAHLLKRRYQPRRATRSWENPIENGREESADILEQSPSLHRALPGLMTRSYPRAASQAARDTRLPVTTFPEQPPFTLAEVLGEEP